MTIETKFSLGDKVFFKRNSIIQTSEINKINVYIYDSIIITYSVEGYYHLGFFFEYELFKSKEELIKHYENLK